MTSPQTDVSETEVEAAALGIINDIRVNRWKLAAVPDLNSVSLKDREDYRSHARAALTAAARVRERKALVADNAREDQLTLRTGDELTDLIPIYAATEDTIPADPVVQCKCGWKGNQSRLLAAEMTTDGPKSVLRCPRCDEGFSVFPVTEDQGPDVLGERKGG